MRGTSSLYFLIILFGIIVILASFRQPYKEILECKADECSIEKHYILKDNNYTYLFNRNDELRIDRRFRRRNTTTTIKNESEYGKNIFDNRLSYISAKKLLKLIKSDTPDIKAEKYWIGFKIGK